MAGGEREAVTGDRQLVARAIARAAQAQGPQALLLAVALAVVAVAGLPPKPPATSAPCSNSPAPPERPRIRSRPRRAGRTHPSPGNDSREGQRRGRHAPARRRQNQRFQQAIGYRRGRGRPAVGPGGAPGRKAAMALMPALLLFPGVAQQLLK